MYLHINCHGDVEPCVFCHFAVDNIKQKSLKEAVNSPLFKAVKAKQPFNRDHRMPCMLIDNPAVLREVIKETGARPTHPDAESLVTSLAPHLDRYSQGLASYIKTVDEAKRSADEAKRSVTAAV
jgi:hypothetical protein